MSPELRIPGSTRSVRTQPSGTLRAKVPAAGLAPAVALFEQAAQEVSLPATDQPILIADYGAADGRNSLRPISRAVAAVRRRTAADHPILVTHTDLPHNDFSALFATLSDDPDSYLNTDSASFSSVIGRSFYSQILPSGTVHLGWTSWATQWLSRLPTGAGDHASISERGDAVAHAAYARQAALDWHDFVAFRGRELAPDGRLVVLTTALDTDGTFGYHALIAALVESLEEQVANGSIVRQELARMVIPTFARTEADFRSPFAPRGLLEGVAISHLELFNAEDRYWSRYQSDGNAQLFGSHWAEFARVAMFSTLACALDNGPDNKPEDSRAQQFITQLEASVAARLAAAPQPMRIPLACVVLVKRPRSF